MRRALIGIAAGIAVLPTATLPGPTRPLAAQTHADTVQVVEAILDYVTETLPIWMGDEREPPYPLFHHEGDPVAICLGFRSGAGGDTAPPQDTTIARMLRDHVAALFALPEIEACTLRLHPETGLRVLVDAAGNPAVQISAGVSFVSESEASAEFRVDPGNFGLWGFRCTTAKGAAPGWTELSGCGYFESQSPPPTGDP